MSDHVSITDGTFINSIVGEGTTFRGELILAGLLRIDGDFAGTITTAGKVLVGKNGRAECTIKAGTVVVGGIVRGNIVSTEKVMVLSTGMVIGNISTPRLVVEEGVVLNGSCLVSREAAGAKEATRDGISSPHASRAVPDNEGREISETNEEAFRVLARELQTGGSFGGGDDGSSSWNP